MNRLDRTLTRNLATFETAEPPGPHRVREPDCGHPEGARGPDARRRRPVARSGAKRDLAALEASLRADLQIGPHGRDEVGRRAAGLRRWRWMTGSPASRPSSAWTTEPGSGSRRPERQGGDGRPRRWPRMTIGAHRHTGGCVPRPPLSGGPARIRSISVIPGAFSQIASGSRRTHRPTGAPGSSVHAGRPVDSKEHKMASEQQLERSMLDGKDREELHAIAGAMGVKGITRLRKADLVDAILAAAAGRAGGAGNGEDDRGRQRRGGEAEAGRPLEEGVRAGRRGQRLAALAAEEDALASAERASPRSRPSPARGRRRDRSRRGRDAEPGQEQTPRRRRVGGTAERDDANAPRDRRRRRARVVRRGQPHRTPAPPPSRPRPRRAAAGGSSSASPSGGGEPREREFSGEPIEIEGLLDLRDEGYGFLRTSGYLAGPQRRVRVGVAGAPLRAAQGRLRQGRDPPAGEQREVPGAAARRRDQRHDPRRRAQPAALRGPHAAVPRRAAPPRARSTSPQRDHRPDRRPASRRSARASAA